MAAPKKIKYVECLCLRRGQVRLRNGHIKTCSPGEVISLNEKEIPAFMERVDEVTVKARGKDGTMDFELATKEMLEKTSFDLNELIAFMQKRFDKDLDIHPDSGKKAIIEKLMEYRISDLD